MNLPLGGLEGGANFKAHKDKNMMSMHWGEYQVDHCPIAPSEKFM